MTLCLSVCVHFNHHYHDKSLKANEAVPSCFWLGYATIISNSNFPGWKRPVNTEGARIIQARLYLLLWFVVGVKRNALASLANCKKASVCSSSVVCPAIKQNIDQNCLMASKCIIVE